MNDTKPRIKAIFFDFLGTLLDWHTPISNKIAEAVRTHPSHTTNQSSPLLSSEEISLFALNWRASFFRSIANRHTSLLPPEDIDTTHRRTLIELISTYPHSIRDIFTPELITSLISQWHNLQTWPDVLATLRTLKREFPNTELFILANGTTRLHLDLLQSSNLNQDSLITLPISSQMLGCYKPDPEAYLKAMDLIGLTRDQEGLDSVVMVAAHAYDLRAARSLIPPTNTAAAAAAGRKGMQTVYVRRWTEDYGVDEDFERVRVQNDAFLEEGQFAKLTDVVRDFNRDLLGKRDERGNSRNKDE